MKNGNLFRNANIVPRGGRFGPAALCLICFCLASHAMAQQAQPEREAGRAADGPQSDESPAKKADEADSWIPLFDGQTLDGWKVANFGGEGEVKVDEGRIVLEFGYSLTGITLDQPFPKVNYEITLQAMRLDGIDFFCGLTFPVNESHCSLIVAGWAGSVVGLSSIDGHDASDNDTTRYMTFEDNRWYTIRLRVTEDRIQAWIDEERVIDLDIRGKKITTRTEVDLSKPLGISAWETRAALRDIRYRLLTDELLAGEER